MPSSNFLKFQIFTINCHMEDQLTRERTDLPPRIRNTKSLKLAFMTIAQG